MLNLDCKGKSNLKSNIIFIFYKMALLVHKIKQKPLKDKLLQMTRLFRTHLELFIVTQQKIW